MQFLRIFLFTAVITFTGCEDFLEENPKGMVSAELLFENQETITQTLNGVYHPLRDVYGFRNFSLMFGLTSDDIEYVNIGQTDRTQLNNYTYTNSNNSIEFLFYGTYKCIVQANMILEMLPTEETIQLPAEFLDRVRAETHFLRGWAYFQLARAYKTVPLITTYENMPLYPPRGDEDEIWNLIIDDFIKGAEGLPSWESISQQEKGRASVGAAKSALAWAYLTRASLDIARPDDMEKARAWLKDVIDNEKYGLWDDYLDAFHTDNKNGKEDIFSFQQLSTDGNFAAFSHKDYSPRNTPDLVGRVFGNGNFILTNALYESFEPGDKRLNAILCGDYYLWKDTGDPAQGFHGWIVDSSRIYTTEKNPFDTAHYMPHGQKWLDFNLTDISDTKYDTNFPLLRYSNILLLYSEVVNELDGATTEAYEGINLVRDRAGLAPVSGLDQDQLREAIRKERYTELWGEGVRWFDLMRWGNKLDMVKAAKPHHISGNIDPALYTYHPIHIWDTDSNENLTTYPEDN